MWLCRLLSPSLFISLIIFWQTNNFSFASSVTVSLLMSQLWEALKSMFQFLCNCTRAVKIELWYKNKKTICTGGGMNFPSRSHSMGDISGMDATTLAGGGGPLLGGGPLIGVIGAGRSLHSIPAARFSSNAPPSVGEFPSRARVCQL